MIPEFDTYDEFGENRLVSRLNRRFSDLMSGVFRLPKSWSEEPRDCFRRHLARINNLALTLLLAGGAVMAILLMALAIKFDSSVLFFVGLGVVPGIYLVQFIVGLFCSANLNLTFGQPVNLVSRLIPEVLTVVGVLAVIATLFTGINDVIDGFSASLQLGLTTTATFFVKLAMVGVFSWVAANSERLLGVSVTGDERQGPAEYLFSLVLYMGRFLLALVSYQFLATVLVVGFVTIYTAIAILIGQESMGNFDLGRVLPLVSGTVSWFFLAIAFMPPVSAHFVYLFVVAVADIGVAFFRMARSSERVARLSEEAMTAEAPSRERE